MSRTLPLLLTLLVSSCARGPVGEVDERTSGSCTLVSGGFGPRGEAPLRVEVIAEGLEVPWGLAFLPDGDALLTERPGRVRLIRDGALVAEPVATLALEDLGTEGGLLGIALHPEFPQVRDFFLYTAEKTNEVQRWTLAPDGLSATFQRVILGSIPSADFHSGGRLRIGPDRLLYVSTGDAKQPELAQDVSSLAGKLLRITPEGAVPDDNPFPGSPTYLLGIRNSQGFDWAAPDRLYVSDHGPTGEFLRTGRDEINFARPGNNLGWPETFGCMSRSDWVVPSLTWDGAVPPGGALFYEGDAIPEWNGTLLITTLGAEHVHLVRFDPERPERVTAHEVYLHERHGRLREIAQAPDGSVWVTTSNCDSYGVCPPEKDRVLRITR